MNKTKQCNKGHFYREELEKCPFCSDKKAQEDSIENTKLNNSSEKALLKTKLNQTNNTKEILQKVIIFFSDLKKKLSKIFIDENSFFSLLKNKFFHNFIAASMVTFFLFWSLLPLISSYTNNGEEFELNDLQGLSIEEVSNELEQLGLKYQIIDSVFIDSLGGVKVKKGTISIQDPIAGTFVKEGRTLYFTVRRIVSEKIRIPEEVFDGKDKTYMQNNFGYNFKLVFIPENGSVDLVVKSLSSGGSNLVVGDSLIKGSTINVYLELDEDIDKDNRRFIDNLQSTDSIITE
tara:strand:- start:650 stop:1519 length:870 start_codon:yes stop_codon:yes gene_type:complete